jgi:hypothetical protein
MRKSTVVILSQPNIKNNKNIKYNFEKNHNKKQLMWRNTVAINSVLKKKTIKLNSQPAQYEKNKKKFQKNHKKRKKPM